MFTTYVKSLNDMVFSTSESPEEQPSTGVLGRIGSWFSPWRGKGPKSPTENDSPTTDEALKSEGVEEGKESARPQVWDQRWEEEEKERRFDPSPRDFSRDSFLCEEKDATQSAHRHDSAGADQAHAQPQAQRQARVQTGKRLHVYLEETSVIHCGKDICIGQEVIRTKVTGSLQALTKTKSSPGFDSAKSLSSTRAHSRETHVKCAVGEQSYYTALGGVSVTSHKEPQSQPEPDREQTETDNMGRKNAARRKYRKTSQSDKGNSTQEKTPPNEQLAPEGFPPSDNSVTSAEGQSPNTHMGESSENSSPRHNLTSQASPMGGESKTPCPDMDKHLANTQDSNTVTADTLACAVDEGADMEDDDSLYKVERKTETPESKRRSIKVSRSEVKLFTKYVPLNPAPKPTGDKQELKSALRNAKEEEEKTRPRTEVDARLPNVKKSNEEPKPVTGRIADRIGLFEHQRVTGIHKGTFQTTRSANVSPVRKVTERLKEYDSPAQRSRSAERQSPARSGPVVAEKAMTIKERIRNFTEASKSEAKTGLPQRPAMTGMPQKSTSSVAVAPSDSKELDGQGKLDAKELIKTKAMLGITLKPDDQDTTSVGLDVAISKQQPADTVTSKTDGPDTKCKSAVSTKGAGDSSEVTSDVSPQSKGPSRIGSRSKRRKSKEPASPTSPNSENKATSKLQVTTIKPDQVEDTVFTGPACKQPTVKVSISSDKATEKTSEKQADTKPKDFKQEMEVSENQEKPIGPSFKKYIDKSVNRKDKLPEPSVERDEPDTASHNSGTKKPIDKEPVILAQKDEKAGGHSLVLTQKREKTSKDSGRHSDSSPSTPVDRPIEKSSSKEQESPVESPKSDKESSVQPEAISAEKEKQPSPKDVKLQASNKDTEPVTSESEHVGKEEKAAIEKTNQSERKAKEKPQQLPHPDKNTTDSTVSESEQGKVEKPSVAKPDETNTAGKKEESVPITDMAKAKDLRSTVDLPEQVCPTHPEEAAAPAVTSTNDAVSHAESDVGPLTKATAAEVTPDLQTKPVEMCGTDTEPVAISSVPQSNSVSVEKMGNSPDDSHARGANDVELSSSKPITRATAAVGEESVKAVNDSPVLMNAQADSVAEKALSVKESSPIPVSKSTSSEGAEQDDGKTSTTVKSVLSEGNISGDVREHVSSHSQSTATEEIPAQCPSDSNAFKATARVTGKTLTGLLPNEPSSLPNGDILSRSQVPTVKKEVDDNNKPSQTPKVPASPEANKRSQEPTKRSPLKKLHLPQGLIIDDAFKQDAPSSWLDVDFPKRKLKVSEAKLTSSGSESNLLDASDELDDNNFVERIKKLCAPFSLPPRKHNHFRPPQPPFAMPAIKEARFEKTFDPDEFKFGLSKKKQFGLDTPQSVLAKLQTTETKSGLKPARASLANRSLLLSSLDTESRLRETDVPDEVDAKEEKDIKVKVKSRLEGSCVLSSLTSSFKGKKNGTRAEAEAASSEEDSPTRTPQRSPPPLTQPPPPSPTGLAPIIHIPALSGREEAAEAGIPEGSDSKPSLPSFHDIKLPDYLEKYFHREPVQSTQAEEKVNTKVTEIMTSKDEVDPAVKAAPVLPDVAAAAAPPCFPVIPPNTPSPLPEQPVSLPTRMTGNHVRAAKGFYKRPGKMVLFEKAEFSGQAYEIHRDVADATSMQLSPLISVKVVRGCWVLHEKPGFQGRCIALEEGGIELENMWAEADVETEPQNAPPMQIGSIRLAVCDYSPPHIDLFTEPKGHGRVSPFHDDTIETGSFGIPLSTASIQVHSGVWLLFSDPGFQGMLAVLDPGVYPFPETWGFTSPFVGSLRPLKMGGFKVENPSEVKAVLYEKPGFEGSYLEIDSDVFSFCEGEEDNPAQSAYLDTVKAVGSLKIIGGLWVGYSQPGFEGQQHILEEGEFLDCSDWGGSEQLQSMRPILADFMSPHLKMFSERDFGKLGVNVDLTVPVINMDDTGYGTKTQSIDVISGVWVVFEEPGFCGESYILEKGLYGSPEDWGALQPRVASAMPVMLDDFESTAKFKVQLFSDSSLEGPVISLEDSVASLPDEFSVASCKVVAGSWLAFEGEDFTGRMYVLEEGSYPDLRAMGCDNGGSSIMSLQPVGFEFSLPSITLFERCSLRGKRVVLTDGSVNLQLAGGCSRVQSVVVEGGMWVLYEGINYLGAQILLKPGEIVDWRKFSGWNKIGSLRPLTQKQVHFRVRNRQSGLMMSVTGDMDDVKLMRIQEMEETNGFEQIWFYHNGYLHCKLLEECCLYPSSSVTMAGSRLGLTPQPDQHIHLWSITPEGFIRYTPTDLVLEVKGGHHFDKSLVILNSFDPNKPQQRWDVEVL
ncbi:beta/gamma crystallin domain-containing protein 1-like isoform X1 [Solea solea]|uniref:beta/gamma crystallin domain-containing protein 1-like isoform X1 n=1 Tax=Solea solea TaxID=90069 RepID=UPI00272BD6B1|nr:beta/gamma crystallin domain-containing protein 1-like isoform X1 [Solea solea]